VDEWVCEVAGGMDLGRRRLLAVMDSIERGGVATLVVAHRDRLARFGVDYLEHVATTDGCTVLVADQQCLSPEREVVEDLLAIIDTFSCGLDGLRRFEKVIRADLAGGSE
jgi:putative resolvase